MQITKRNGVVVLFDTEKIAASILKANSGISFEHISEKQAAIIASEVFERVTRETDLVTTEDVHHEVYAILKEKLFLKTAESFKSFYTAKTQ